LANGVFFYVVFVLYCEQALKLMLFLF